MDKKAAPYGTWSSPITADAITHDSIDLKDTFIDLVTCVIYHLESRPSDGGRIVVVNTREGRDIFGSQWNARSGVQEYGGAAAIAHAGVVYFSHFVDNRVYEVKNGAEPKPITPENKNHRFADFCVHPKYTWLLVAILEDHTHPLPSEVVTSLCVIDTKAKTISPLVSGADFYSIPRFSPDGNHLAWQQWSHPDMPWYGTEIYVAGVTVTDKDHGDTKVLSITQPAYVAGEKRTTSAVYPFWASSDILVFTSDISGYQNPWKYSVVSNKAGPVLIHPLELDFSATSSSLGMSSGAALDDKTVLYSALRDGRNILYRVDLRTGTARELECPYVNVSFMRRSGTHEVVFVGGKSNEPSAVVLCTLDPTSPNIRFTTLISSATPAVFPASIVSSPRPITLNVPPDNQPLHVIFYAPTNPEYAGSSIKGEKPPCIVSVHGGPTGKAGQGLNWRTQYFTSRGWAWLDVNYGGSSGYGRKYMERLISKWGIVDVEDCVHASQQVASTSLSLIDPARVIICGGSAGGFTVLASLCAFPDTFAAATSYFGISDLRKLAEFTHKFEARYLDNLMGGTLEEIPEVYKERSPLFHADSITSPLLILQGSIDAVVPPDQAEAIVKSIKKRGGKVEYMLFDGEGHGFRKAETIKVALEKEIQFYNEVLGLKR